MDPRDQLTQLIAMRGNDPMSGNRPMQLPPTVGGFDNWYQGPAYPSLEDRFNEYLKTLPQAPPATTSPTPPGFPGGVAGAMPQTPQLMPLQEGPPGVPRLTPEQLDAIQGPKINRSGQGEQHRQRQGFTI